MSEIVLISGQRHVAWQCLTCGVFATCPEVVYDQQRVLRHNTGRKQDHDRLRSSVSPDSVNRYTISSLTGQRSGRRKKES